MGKRIEYLDNIKALSIILVVFCHHVVLKNDGVLDNIFMLLCWLAVPCFFMCTGAIFCNREMNFKKWIRKITVSYVVLVVWKIIYLIFFCYIKKWNILDVDKVGIIKYVFFFNSFNGIDDSVMWFMYAYIAVLIISPMINIFFTDSNHKEKYIYVILGIILFFSCIVNDINILLGCISKNYGIKNLSLGNIKGIYPFSGYSLMIGYYILGGILVKHNLYEKYKKKSLICLICAIAVVLSIFILMLIKYNYTKSFKWNGIYLQTGYNTFFVCVMSVAVFALIQGITGNNKYLKYVSVIGKNTMGIYYLHIPIIIVVEKYIYRFINIDRGIIFNLVKVAITVSISLVISYIIKKIPVLRKIVT